MRYAIILMLVVAAAFGVFALGTAAGGKPTDHDLEKFQRGELSSLDFATAGDAAGETPFVGPDGEAISVSGFAGQPTLVNYWATWCGPCERELPSLGVLQTARAAQGLQVIVISVDGEEDGPYARQRLAELTGDVLDFYHAADYGPVYEAGVRGFPTTILYDASGTEVFRLAGEADWASYEALALIDAALAKR